MNQSQYFTKEDLISHEVIDLTEDESYEYVPDMDYQLEEALWHQMLYSEFIRVNAEHGLHTQSLADEMQSLGTCHSQIGTRLTFQMMPAHLVHSPPTRKWTSISISEHPNNL